MTEGSCFPDDAAAAHAARELVEAGRYLGARHWVPATSGNFSHRVDAARAAITRSGVEKGLMVEADVMLLDIAAPPPKGSSAETGLHLALYRDRPETGAILHTHSHAASVVSRVCEAKGELVLEGWELQKAFTGTTTHDCRIVVPVFPNTQDIAHLAQEASARLRDMPGTVCYLISGHGLYAWGRTMAEARRHVVALEHLLACELDMWKLGELTR